MRNPFHRWFGKKRADLVPFRDLATGTTTLIPKAELGPGVVLIQMQGEAGPVYADSSELRLGPHRHESLDEEVMAAVEEFVSELSDISPLSLEEWVDGFLRDLNPEREVAGWLHLSRILRYMTDHHWYAKPERQECFRILVACFTGARETVLERSDPELLPADQVNEMVKYFFEGGYA